jgi:hypothetical protein
MSGFKSVPALMADASQPVSLLLVCQQLHPRKYTAHSKTAEANKTSLLLQAQHPNLNPAYTALA